MTDPPRLPRLLLRLVLPRHVAGASIRADLLREYQELAEQRGRPPNLWYWREALALAAHWIVHRLRPSHAPDAAVPMDRTRHNLRLAFRRLLRNPGFAAVAVLTMALGIGANVGTFSVVDAVLLEPLPYDDPDDLVALWEWNVPRDRRENVINPGNFRDWRERSTSFEDMAALTLTLPRVLTGVGEPREARTVVATPNTFGLLGVEAALGRTFSPEAGTRDGGESILTHAFWMDVFGGDPDVVGRTLTVQGQSTVVVGVLPPVLVPFGEEADLFASYTLTGDQTSAGRFLYAVGRLAEGITVQVARDELQAVAATLEEEHPDFKKAGGSFEKVPRVKRQANEAKK